MNISVCFPQRVWKHYFWNLFFFLFLLMSLKDSDHLPHFLHVSFFLLSSCPTLLEKPLRRCLKLVRSWPSRGEIFHLSGTLSSSAAIKSVSMRPRSCLTVRGRGVVRPVWPNTHTAGSEQPCPPRYHATALFDKGKQMICAETPASAKPMRHSCGSSAAFAFWWDVIE